MKQNYNFKMLLCAAALSGSALNAQTLEDVLCNLNLDYANVTALVPSMYTFNYDGTNYINDGGSDMYDGGNYLNTNLQTNIPYSDDAIISSAAFGTTGQYFTRSLPGMFVMAADLDGVTSVSITGNVGADGSGNYDAHTFTAVHNGQNYNAFVKRIYNAWDPSVNHVFLIPENVSATHTYGSTTDDDQHNLNNLTGTTRVYYFLVSSASGGFIDNTTIEAITAEFLNSVVGSPSVDASASATTLCEGEELTLTGSGGTGGVFNWDNGVTDNVPFVPAVGTVMYHVNSGAGNGCSADSIEVTVNPNADFTLVPADEIGGNDGGVYINFTDGIFPMQYDWDNDGTGDFDDPQNLVNVPAGTYTVVVENGNGCLDSATATVDSQVGIDENAVEVIIYPIPASDVVYVQLNGAFNFMLTDLSGRTLMTGSANNKAEISVVDLPQGAYLITLQSGDAVVNKQIIKN